MLGGSGSGSGYYYVEYEEGIYVGYRYYETKAYDEADFGNDDWYKENVVYPFDYGLSYTTFDWKIADSTDNSVDLTADGEIQVQVKVTNTGSVAGKDVVQLYYTAPYKAGQIEKSYVALGAYEKTELLQPGESDIVMLSLPVESMASYDYDDANHNGIRAMRWRAATTPSASAEMRTSVGMTTRCASPTMYPRMASSTMRV